MTLVGVVSGVQVVNTLYYGKEENYSHDDLETLCSDLAAWHHDNVRPYLTNNFSLIRVDGTDLSSQSGNFASFVPSSSAGGVTTGPMPQQLALVITFRTGARGRSFRGRNYIPALPGGEFTDQNHVSASFRDHMLEAYNLLIEGLPLQTGVWGVLTRYANKSRRTEGFTTAITSVDANLRVDTQRRRLPKS